MDDKGMGEESASVNLYQGELLAGGTAKNLTQFYVESMEKMVGTIPS
jgi:hypothetical protein